MMIREKLKRKKRKSEILMHSIGAEQTVVVKKLCNESGAKGSGSELYYSVLKISQPEMGGAYGQDKAV